jgi:S-DNA-T family DNA segregation ATPase FtsK/SpoIIIE
MPIFKKDKPKPESGNTVRNTKSDPENGGVPKEKREAGSGGFLSFLKNENFHKVLGGFLILFGVFLLLSFISFLFTWKADQSQVERLNYADYLNPPAETENWMKLLGARLSYLFMYNGFGLAAFPIPVLLIAFGLKLYTGNHRFKLFGIIKYSLLSMAWCSLLFGMIFSTYNPALAGAFGVGFFDWLREISGWIGVVMTLTLSLVAFTTFEFGNYPLKNYISRRNAKAEEEELPEFKQESIFDRDNIIIPEPVTGKQPHEPSESDEDVEDDLDEAELLEGITLVTKPEAPPLLVPKTDSPELILEDPTITEDEPSLDEPEKPDHFGIDTAFDPRLDLSSYKFPQLDFLNDYGDRKAEVSKEDLERSKNLIVETLKNYKIDISQIKATIGPTVTLFEIVPAPGVKISKIKNLEDDIALSLAALGIRIIAPIPGKGTIGIEVPNRNPEIVSMRSVLSSPKFLESTFDLPVCLGKTISNEVYVADLAKMPHLLMAGATGQGKSVGLNAILVSLMYKKHPAELKFVLVDPKKVELTLFNAIERHFLAKLPGDENEAIITDTKKVVNTLNSLCIEMDRRYELLQAAMVRNLKEYNAKFIRRKLNPNDGHRFLPFIVVVIDEVADLIMTAGKEVEHPIGRLAQLARAVGIHLVLATQRPSVNIITGTIKANFPARIAFRVTSKIDSRTILDANGADQLIGKGDLLFSNGNDLIRLQCPFVDTPEVETITEFIGSQRGYASAYVLPEVEEEGSAGTSDFDPNDRDPLFEEAARIVVQHQQGSTSLIQRKLKVGYNRAGRLIDQLEQANIVGSFEGSKARNVLYPDEYSLEQYLNTL